MTLASPGAMATRGPVDLADVLRRAILAGDLVPNQRLVEADLTEQYGVARAGVRLALMMLENEGLVERQPNRGARVRAVTVAEAIEIVEVRDGLEQLCARRAAERLSDEGAAQLGEIRAGIATTLAAGDLAAYAALHQRMDAVIRAESGQRTAALLLERLLAQAARHRFRLSFVPGRAARSAPEHLAIIDAVLARDPDAAAVATAVHLAGIAEALRALPS